MPTPSDPYYHNTVLHLPFDSVIWGMSARGNQLSASGHVAISTVEKKHGAGSAVFDGAGDYLSMPDGDRFVFGTGDFTIEAWVKTSTPDKVLFDKWSGSPGTWRVWIRSSGGLSLYVQSAAVIEGVTNVCNNAWNHVAITRASGQLRVFVNGALDAGPVAYATDLSAVVTTFAVGGQVNNRNSYYDFAGHIDDARITKGVARYTENFTPPGAIEYFNWDDPANIAPSTAESYTFAPYAPPRSVHLPTVAPDPISGIRGGTEYGGRGRIVGTVKNKGEPSDTPVYRRVRLFKDRDGQCVAETWSDPVTGAYAFENINPAHKYTALSYDHTGQFRAVVADNLTPEVF